MSPHSDEKVPLPRRGERVRIPKGAYIRSTHPAGDRIAKKSQVVTVHNTFQYGLEGTPEVSWAGSGGYWCNSWEWEPVASLSASSTAGES